MNFTSFFLKETYRKRTIYRLLFQWGLYQRREVFGGKEVLDIGSGGNPSYGEYVYPMAKKVIKTDYKDKSGIDHILDFNHTFSFEDATFDVVILCNALYIAEDPKFVFSEINRVLRPSGHLVLVNPYVANEMPEPHDYSRLTREGIEKFTNPFFKTREISPIGERGSVAVYALQPFLFIWPLRVIGYALGLLLDRIIPKNVIAHHPLPIGYIYVGEKNTTS